MSDPSDPLRNPRDPLHSVNDGVQKELLHSVARTLSGASLENVIYLAMNLLLNALRQGYPSQRLAENRLDELYASMRQMLTQHYDSVTGKRRNLFPFTQVLEPSLFVDKDTSRREN